MSNLSINKGVSVKNDVNFNGKKEKVSDNKPSNDEGMKTSTKLMLGATALAAAVTAAILLKNPAMSKSKLTKFAKENAEKAEKIMSKKRKLPELDGENCFKWENGVIEQHIEQGDRTLIKKFNPDGTLMFVQYNNGGVKGKGTYILKTNDTLKVETGQINLNGGTQTNIEVTTLSDGTKTFKATDTVTGKTGLRKFGETKVEGSL